MLVLALIVVVTLVLLVTEVVRIEVVALGLIAVLGLSGLSTPAEAFSGFSNPATLTVAAMLVLSAALERAGVVDWICAALGRRGRGSATSLLLFVAGPTALFSAFMNNTAVVALMIPVVLTLARRTEHSASKLLLPISYLSILAGTCTLIGTSTNILIDSLYRQSGGEGFGMFEFSGLGLAYLALGGLYVIVVVPRVLPERAGLSQMISGAGSGNFVTEVEIPEDSSLAGQRLEEIFGKERELRVLELIRGEEATLKPMPNTSLRVGDVLLIEGTARTLHEILDQRQVVHGTAVADSERLPISRIDLRLVEAVVTPNSRFLHRRIQDLELSRRQNVQVLAVRRQGRRHQYTNLRGFRIRSGDVLLLQGERESLVHLQEEDELILIEGVERTLTFPRKAPLALIILGAVVALAAADVAPISLLSVAGVAAALLTGLLTLSRATRALEPGVLFLLAGMIPLGQAMETSGLAALISDWVVKLAAPWGPVALIGAFYLLTSTLTEVLSNNAAAVLLTPVCLGAASAAGIDPKPLLVAVAFGASASFATPIGYQTNTMVMGPGGYQFRDYLRVGLPLNLLLAAVATAFIPLIWPP